MMPLTGLYLFAKQGCDQFPDKTAIIYHEQNIAYRELFEMIDRTSSHFSALGIQDDTVVTIHLSNCLEAVIAIYAVARLGGICNMVHHLIPPSGIEDYIKDADSKFLITNSELEFDGVTVISKSEIREFSTSSVCSDHRCVQPFDDKPAVYIHSSGSTGKPKTVVMGHYELNRWIINFNMLFKDCILNEQICLSVSPLYHCIGLVAEIHRSLSIGATIVMMDRWDRELAINLIKKNRISVLTGAPKLFLDLLSSPDFSGEEISQLKQCYVGGDSISREMIKDFDKRVGPGRHLFTIYGLSESGCGVCALSPEHSFIDASGFPINNTTVAVLTETGDILSEGEGELLLHSDTMMIGYLNDPDATKEVFLLHCGKKYIRTGDFGRVDSEGYVYFSSRKKSIIVHNGYNIFPKELEEIIYSVKGVKEVCVMGLQDSKSKTENVYAAVVANRQGCENLIKKDILSECHKRLPKYSIPKDIIFVDIFPRNLIGKLDRLALRDLLYNEISKNELS